MKCLFYFPKLKTEADDTSFCECDITARENQRRLENESSVASVTGELINWNLL